MSVFSEDEINNTFRHLDWVSWCKTLLSSFRILLTVTLGASIDDRNNTKILGHLFTRHKGRGWGWQFLWRWNPISFVQKKKPLWLRFLSSFHWLAVSLISCDDQTNTFVLPNATEESRARKEIWRLNWRDSLPRCPLQQNPSKFACQESQCNILRQIGRVVTQLQKRALQSAKP